MAASASGPPEGVLAQVKSTLLYVVRTLSRPPSFRGSERRTVAFLIGVFLVVLALLGVVVAVFMAHEVPPPPMRITFSASPAVARSGLTFTVAFNVTASLFGPYPAGGLVANLSVQGFAGQAALGPSGVAVSVPVGPNSYPVTWTDLDHDGSVGVGDGFAVTGLPALSACSFSLFGPSGIRLGTAYWTTTSE